MASRINVTPKIMGIAVEEDSCGKSHVQLFAFQHLTFNSEQIFVSGPFLVCKETLVFIDSFKKRTKWLTKKGKTLYQPEEYNKQGIASKWNSVKGKYFWISFSFCAILIQSRSFKISLLFSFSKKCRKSVRFNHISCQFENYTIWCLFEI